jgi:hypothetical protein
MELNFPYAILAIQNVCPTANLNSRISLHIWRHQSSSAWGDLLGATDADAYEASTW